MPSQRKAASPARASKKAAKKASPGRKAAKPAGKGKARKGPDAVVVSKRDKAVKDSGADMEDEAPQGERHGDIRANLPGSRVAHGAGETSRKEAAAEHAHRDPRWTQPKLADKWLKAKRDPRKEGGLSKERQVRRLDGMVNWFRRAPKPKA